MRVDVVPEETVDAREARRQRGEHVGYPLRLASAMLGRADFADDHRLAGGDFHDSVVGGRVDLREARPRGVPVVAVEAGPVDVAIAGVEPGEGGPLAVRVDVWAPNPPNVGRAGRVEDLVHVAPSCDE